MNNKIIGTPQRPRLYVYKSNKHIYAQIIDDINHYIICSHSTLSNNILKYSNCTNAKIVGQQIASKLKNKQIYNVIFDRGRNIYHGQIKALADATRQEGINF